MVIFSRGGIFFAPREGEGIFLVIITHLKITAYIVMNGVISGLETECVLLCYFGFFKKVYI